MKKVYVPIWLSYAFLCILCWGVWAFLSKMGADQMTPMQMQVLFTIGMLPVVLVAVVRLGRRIDTDLLGATYGILNGIFTGLGLLAYFAALSRGKASIVSPITALFPLLTVLLAFFLLRERMNRVQMAGLVLALSSIFILSR